MRSSTRRRRFAIVVAALLTTAAALFVLDSPVEAHALGLIRVRLVEVSPSQYTLEIKLPMAAQAEGGTVAVPARCSIPRSQLVQSTSDMPEIHVLVDCGRAPLSAGDVLIFPWPVQGAFVSVEWRTQSPVGRFFDGTPSGVSVPLAALAAHANRGALDVARRYVALGVEHILTGWDHLAFVLALCLAASGWRLLRLVTAFTLGHSLTLALAAGGVVHVPVAPTEAAIALSIAFVAREGARGHALSMHGGGLVFAFGLLHGLGFASALAESGIDRSEFLVGLMTFNAGVELGQLAFVAAALGVMSIGTLFSIERRAALVTATAYAIGVLGAFWTIQRTV
jgi:hypothetical protein